MTAGLRVPGSVAIGRTVTTQGNAAGLAGAQMYPAVAGFYALLAHVTSRLFDRRQGIDMAAG